MPIYEYRCENGHTFEVMQRMADPALEKCIECGAPVQRVFHPVAIHFKGKGFYNTDYGKKSRGASKDGEGSKDSDSSKSGSKEPASSSSSSSSSSDSKSSSSDSKTSTTKSSD
jgi:putative FmdB family regulatory protein